MEFKNAAAYIRVSTEDQTEYSPDAQLRELQDYAAAHSLLICKVYSDEGISGRRAEKRPGFMQMIADARSNEHPYDVILVHKFDRFARNREDSIVYKSMLKRAGVDVVSIKEPLSDGAYSGVMEAIYESFAEAYSINLGQEVKKGMKEKHLRGEPQTIPPFGYYMKDKQFQPHETEAPIVHQIFERFVSGESMYSISQGLNRQGVRTHRGGRFENRTIDYILHNPVYIGKLRWNPKHRTRRDFDDPHIITVPAKHQPIVEQELWDSAQVRIAELKAKWKYHGRPSSDRHHWLCGIVRCSTCGGTLVWVNPHFMKCNNYCHGACSSTQHISVELLEAAFISRLREDLLSSAPLCASILRTAPQRTEQQELQQTVDRIQKKRTRLTEAYLNEAITLEEFKRLQSTLDADLAAATAELSSLSPQQPEDHSATLREVIDQTLRTLNSDADIATKYEALNSIIDTCIFDKSQMLLSITYRIML